MPTLTGPAIDPTLPAPGDVWVAAGLLAEPEIVATPPEPGDPDVAFDPTPATLAPLVQVVISRAVSREPVGWLSTAEVEDWDTDVELLVGTSASITASSWDPLLSAMASRSWVGADGRMKHEWDPKGYIATIHVDGMGEETFVFRRPIDIGGDRVLLSAEGPQAIFAERILGRAEQVDLLDDRGSFEGYASVAEMESDGWRFDDGVTASLVADGVRGSKCLQVTGDGWVAAPKVTLIGQDGVGRTAEGAAFGKWPEDVAVGDYVVETYTQRTDSLAPSNEDLTLAKAGTRPDSSTGWSDGPVTSGAVMSAQAVAHRTWPQVRSFAGLTCRYDLVTLRQGILTGFLVEKDLAYYVERILRDLNSRSLGGSSTGLTTRIMALTGTEAQMVWAHNQRQSVRDVLTMILDADGGPECRITPGWVLEVWDRLGQDRTDVALTVLDVAEPTWAVDPGAQVEDFVADTGRGSGTSTITATVSQPYDPDQHRITRIVQAPVDRSFDQVESWARRHARAAARIQATATVDVVWAAGRRLAVGDVIWVTLHDGDQGLDRQMRVINLRHKPNDGLVSVTLGAVDA